jgi:hypothetical protein
MIEICKSCSSHSGDAEDSSLLGCSAMSTLFELLHPEDEDATNLLIISNYVPVNMAPQL